MWEFLALIFWTAAISYGVAVAGQAIFGQDLKEPDQVDEDVSSRSWNPRTTQQEGLPRPRAYGRNMHHGNVVAKWTDVVDNREVLYLIVEHGDGPTKGNVADQIWLNDQPLSNFGSVVVQERKGLLDQDCPEGFEKQKLEHPKNLELKYADGAYIWTTPNNNFDDIEYTICFPNGLIKYHKTGSVTTGIAGMKVRIREHPSGDWVPLMDTYITGASLTPVFKKYTVNTQEAETVERGKQYDLEFTRTTQEGGTRHVDQSFLRSVREVVDIPFERPGKAFTAIKAIATSQLSGSLDVKIIREDRIINTFNGSTWTLQYSRNRAWVVFDLLTQPVISGDGDSNPWTIKRYDGIDPSRLDVTFFYNWAEFCSDQVASGYPSPDHLEDRLACDIIVDYQTNIWDLAYELAQIGRAKIYWAGYKVTGWIDKATTPTDLVTMDTVMARSWRNRWMTVDEVVGSFEVFYRDKRQGYERTYASMPNPAAASPIRTVSIEGRGVTTYGTALHIANHELQRNLLIRNTNNFRQHKDAFRHKLGEVIRLQHKVPDWGQGYRVVSCPSSSVLKVDRDVEDVNVDDLLYIRSYDEGNEQVDISVYTVLSTSGRKITITGTWSPTPVKNNNCAVGITGSTVLRRITKIEPTVENWFDIEVETYDATLYTADDLDPAAPNKDYIWSAPAQPLTKPASHDDIADLINLALPPIPDIDSPYTSNCNWTGSSGTTVAWSKTDPDDPIIFRYKGVSYEIEPGSTTDKFIYWDPNYTNSFRSNDNADVAVELGKWYMCRNKAGVAYPTKPFSSVHAGVLQVGTITAALAQIADAAIETAKIKDLAVETLKIAGVAVTTEKIADDATHITETAQVSGYSIRYDQDVWYNVIDVEITSLGGIVNLSLQTFFDNDSGYGSNQSIRIKRDSTIIDTDSNYCGPNTTSSWVMQMFDIPGAGTYTYKIEAKTDNSYYGIADFSKAIQAVESLGK